MAHACGTPRRPACTRARDRVAAALDRAAWRRVDLAPRQDAAAATCAARRAFERGKDVMLDARAVAEEAAQRSARCYTPRSHAKGARFPRQKHHPTLEPGGGSSAAAAAGTAAAAVAAAAIAATAAAASDAAGDAAAAFTAAAHGARARRARAEARACVACRRRFAGGPPREDAGRAAPSSAAVPSTLTSTVPSLLPSLPGLVAGGFEAQRHWWCRYLISIRRLVRKRASASAGNARGSNAVRRVRCAAFFSC